MRVLVAEDDREMNAVLAEALARDGHEILAVGNGTEAMAALAGGQQAVLDAAVMDVRMPGLSGLQILAKLRGNGSRLPVIIITAFGEHAIHQQALSLGAARVFDKPFDVDDLRAAVMGLWNELRAAQR
jgi:DNA-binding response OmpR family regulator